MKKQYESPYAEKVEFDYKESVAACFSPFDWFGKKEEESKVVNNQNNQQQKSSECGSWWVNQNVGKQNNPYWGC